MKTYLNVILKNGTKVLEVEVSEKEFLARKYADGDIFWTIDGPTNFHIDPCEIVAFWFSKNESED